MSLLLSLFFDIPVQKQKCRSTQKSPTSPQAHNAHVHSDNHFAMQVVKGKPLLASLYYQTAKPLSTVFASVPKLFFAFNVDIFKLFSAFGVDIFKLFFRMLRLSPYIRFLFLSFLLRLLFAPYIFPSSFLLPAPFSSYFGFPFQSYGERI